MKMRNATWARIAPTTRGGCAARHLSMTLALMASLLVLGCSGDETGTIETADTVSDGSHQD
jgi:hypothetical protein